MIDVFGTKYKIKYIPKAIEKDNFILSGECDFDNGLITIALANKEGKLYSPEEIRKNAIHEVLHAICSEGQYFDINDNEPFIEWCARCINNLIKQKVL